MGVRVSDSEIQEKNQSSFVLHCGQGTGTQQEPTLHMEIHM